MKDAMNTEIKDLTRDVQTLSDVPEIRRDGVWGPNSARAVIAKFKSLGVELPTAPLSPPMPAGDRVDARSETAIATLHPRLQSIARAFIKKASLAGPQIKITSGTRTYAEQNALYEQGRARPGKIVTGARGGQSSHNFGTAFDVTIFKGGAPVWESTNYRIVLAPIGKSLGLSWGGDWSKPDEPHFYLKPEWAKKMSEAAMMAELRVRHDKSIDAFA